MSSSSASKEDGTLSPSVTDMGRALPSLPVLSLNSSTVVVIVIAVIGSLFLGEPNEENYDGVLCKGECRSCVI